MFRRRHLILAAVLGLLPSSYGVAGPPVAGEYSAATYQVREETGRKVKMRDGVVLAVDIFRPDAAGKYPAVLCHTPYNRQGGGFKKRARWFARRGYVVVNSDVRGRYDSDGTWDPFGPKHKTDGYDLVEWLAKQKWCNGNVGMYGLSFMGWTQWWTALTAPPSLRCIVPEVAPPDQFANLPYQQGLLVAVMLDWASTNFGKRAVSVGPGPYGGFARKRFDDFMKTPYLDVVMNRQQAKPPWLEKWLRDNLSTSNYWKQISYQGRKNYAKIRVPSLAASGWFDADYPGTPMNYLGMKRYGATPESRRPRIVIGPWTHIFNRQRRLQGIDFGAGSLIDWNGYVCRWFDYHLKGIKNNVLSDPPVHVFVIGHNRWRSATSWPLPQTKWTRYYLHSNGKANTAGGDGRLDKKLPGPESVDTYIYDPKHPTRSQFTNGHIDGPRDIRKSSAGKEVLVFATPPLKQDLEVVGPITATLYAATSARDTDWIIRLIDLYPDGRAAMLCDGVIRARCRDPERNGVFQSTKLTTIEPDKVYRYTIKFWRGTGNAFLKGHRIRIEISSSYYPYYLRNLNTGDDNVALAIKPVIATQTIYHNAKYPSHVVLPVIPAD